MIKQPWILFGLILLLSACAHKPPRTLPQLSQARIVFIGEYHDNYAHHQNQLHLIQQLHKKAPPIAIGMEMFQKPFQSVLDAYISGEIDEKTMLQKSEYFSRWGYDYLLYRPIMIYAKTHHIPLIALNLPKEITKHISKNGLASLSKSEKAPLPKSLDFTDTAYKQRLLALFSDPKHLQAMPKKHRPNPEYLYQAQILWDETMAERAATYLQTHPETIMILLAGNGHLEYRVGIPNRVKRRIALPMQTILQDSDKSPHKADHYLSPKPIMIKGTPKLGVMLSTQGLEVLGVTEDSLAQKLGLQEGDRLLSLCDMPLLDIADLRLALYLHRHDTITLHVKRDHKEHTLP
jgi:uncharacterized iron-regulated protein